MAGGRYQPGVEAEAGEHADQDFRHFPDTHIVRADARMAHIVDQPRDETVALGVDVGEDGGKPRIGAHAAQSISAWARPSSPRMRRPRAIRARRDTMASHTQIPANRKLAPPRLLAAQ